MAEPPVKRARRTDSSAMWDMNDKRRHSSEPDSDYERPSRREPPARDDGPRNGVRDDRRYRSRSRERAERRRERSRSRDRRDRDRDRDRDGRRDRDKDRDRRGARDRERSTSRDRYYDRRGYPSKSDRYYERSLSPARDVTRARSRTPPRGPKAGRRDERKEIRSREDERQTNGAPDSRRPLRDEEDGMDVDEKDVGEDPEDIEALMRKTMGFTRFRSTQNTKVPGNNIYGVRKEKKTQYRQYMNRPGGFNRPLSPTR
ncbi:hypothetical protein VTN02DRAFT_150 [Thermoascus thermophilus]